MSSFTLSGDSRLSSHPGGAGVTAALGVVAVWFALALAASLGGALKGAPGEPAAAMLAAVTAPVGVFLALYGLSRRFRAFVLALDPRPLVLLHTFRMLGLGFLFLAAHGVLPLAFAVPAGVGDALAAVGALVVGIALYSPGGASRRLVSGWIAFGLADFAIAVATGTLARTGDLLHFEGTVASDAMGAFPLAMIPGFIVPLYVIAHLVVALQLRSRWPGEARIRPGG